MKIDKQIFDSLFDENTPVGKYKTNLNLCDRRVVEVVLLVFKDITKGANWFDFDNRSEDEDGEFDPEEYEEEIRFCGQFPDYEPYGSGEIYIPTRWLWTDDEEIIAEYNRNVEKYRQEEIARKVKEKAKRDDKKKIKLEMQEIIKSKLSKEELKYITFK